MGVAEVANVGLDLGVEFGKTRKVVVFHKHTGSFVHAVYVGRKIYTAVETLAEREALGADVVAIGSCHSVEARVGVVAHAANIEHGNVGREQAV